MLELRFCWKERGQFSSRLVGLFGVERPSGGALLLALLVENFGEVIFDFGVRGVSRKVRHFKRVLAGVVEFFGRALHETVDEEFVVLIGEGGENPGLPVRVVLISPHERFFEIEAVWGEIVNVTPLAIGDRADGVGGAFRVVVVHPE